MMLKSLVFFGLILSTLAFADVAVPPCMDGSKTLSVENEQVLSWKHSTANQFLARAYIQGTLTRLYPDHSGHHHFEVQIGPNSQDTLEVIYNEGFAALPQLQPGMTVQACGDYITSIAQSGGYPASPDGAIIHWVHHNPHGGHDSGFLVINGTVFQ